MQPPFFPRLLLFRALTFQEYVRLQVFEGPRISCCLLFPHPVPKIDDPNEAIPARHIHAIDVRDNHIAIRPTVWIPGSRKEVVGRPRFLYQVL